jgi:hypothetical protein
MKKLIWDDDIEEVDLGDGDFISVANSISVKDVAMLSAAENQIEMSIAMLRQLVKSWRGPSFERNGEVIPCTPENIERLEISTANELAGRLASKMTQDKLDDETKKESIASSPSI